MNSIHKHGDEVASFYFLNQVECTWASHFASISPDEESSKDNQSCESKDDVAKNARLATREKIIHHCNGHKMKMNDLQNFVSQNTKYLFLNYAEHGKDIEETELGLIEILKKLTNMLESK